MSYDVFYRFKRIGKILHKPESPGVLLHIWELPGIWADCFSLEEALRLLQSKHTNAEFKFNP